MEIKVFKDTSKREKTHGGLTFPQWILIVTLLIFIGADIVNIMFDVIPVFIERIILFPILLVSASNAMFRPYGMKFFTWIKLFLKFQTTVQTRTYQRHEEGMKKYRANDFKKDRKVKETIKKTAEKTKD
ncbi:PrgI family protein [Enterococcus faecium]|uniref:PrgI family protein n=1 Tax=Enterococcus faecium TaxID=1352 RepID=UPI00081349DF|nr:PrgI family protein [Enterococcus faecium]